MYKKIRITENTLQVLSLFTNDFSREYYIREVKKILKISPRTAQLILEDLEDKGAIESKTKGKIKTYKIKLSEFTKRYFVFVEQYKAIAFLEKNLMIKEIVEKITPNIKGIGIIFGSYVKGIEKKESDLDIFVAGNYNKEEIKRVSKNLGIDINVKSYPIKTFEKNINKDILLKEILKNHIVFVNVEQFIQKVLKNG
ncbi:MAG: nucleotidyltransferase domain-containing protein [Nanoarchaeota archaeon]|nr:nucleotidyltransferase domain-containing protein [Nanoarchaeota archaeon]MBU1030022.1 nucleotidyltransferase domain-containing protein [Nanoarchaeota archaeon]MBU1849968.1 nucleotidyltransferase domain-containing protein [Nanoarchaeota archaeon]